MSEEIRYELPDPALAEHTWLLQDEHRPAVLGRPPEEPAAPGSYRARARVVESLEAAGRLAKGEILVCRSTTPPWTPLFAIAGALVTGAGGPLSHSAIMAREFGIPA